MAAVAPSSDQAADLLQNLSLDSQPKSLEISDSKKKYGSGNLVNGITKPFQRSTAPRQDFMDPNMCYFPNGYAPTTYYYGGFDGQGNEWVNVDGVETPHGVYGDNGYGYHNGYGYAPYGTYPPPGSPLPTMVHDSQLYGPQQYQYPTYFPPNSGSFTPNKVDFTQADVTTSAADDQKSSVEMIKGNSNGGVLDGNNGSNPVRSIYQNLSPNGSNGSGGLPAGYQDPRFGLDAIASPLPWLETSIYSGGLSKHAASAGFSSPVSYASGLPSGRNHNLRHLMGVHGNASGYGNQFYPNNRLYGQCLSTYRLGSGFGYTGFDTRRYTSADNNKYKTKGRVNGYSGYNNENMDGFNELSRGPRGFKNLKDSVPTTLAVKGQASPSTENNEEKLPQVIDREQYNREDFPDNYSDAKFFIIKSYSEDDVHKSIKYSVWASTPNGNKKLDAAYQEALEKPGDCPVFLLFSVNASRQFVGLAEMVGRVDFDKSVDYWQQDKWNGCFPVKWHIVKDVQNNSLRHITLENNENKPVTNSRDTQEVKFEQGIEMLKIFKGYTSKTCILDDFLLYEDRQKAMQKKKAKQQLIQKQVLETNNAFLNGDKDKNGVVELQKSLENDAALNNEPKTETEIAGKVEEEVKVPNVEEEVKVPKVDEEAKVPEEKGSDTLEEKGTDTSDVEVSKDGKSVVEKMVVSNGVASAC